MVMRKYRRESFLVCQEKYKCSCCWYREKIPGNQRVNFACAKEEWEQREVPVGYDADDNWFYWGSNGGTTTSATHSFWKDDGK